MLRLTSAELASRRRTPGPVSGQTISPSLLKHADAQTVAGLAAVLHAMHDHALDVDPAWGAVAAPCLLGRAGMVNVVERYAAEGAWGVSPHIIPNSSLHALSGTISVALGLRGPNLGVGGGRTAAAEGFLAAAALLADQRVPGLWLVLTAHDPEFIPDRGKTQDASTPVTALALALSSADSTPGLRLRISTSLADNGMSLSLASVAERLAADTALPGRWRFDVGWVEIADDREDYGA